MPHVLSPGACLPFILGDTRQLRKAGGEQARHTERWHSVIQHQGCSLAILGAKASLLVPLYVHAAGSPRAASSLPVFPTEII